MIQRRSDGAIGDGPCAGKRWPCIAVTFDGKPDETTRDGLKAAGFRWDKPKKVWAHGLFGDNANPDSKAQVMRREVAA